MRGQKKILFTASTSETLKNNDQWIQEKDNLGNIKENCERKDSIYTEENGNKEDDRKDVKCINANYY